MVDLISKGGNFGWGGVYEDQHVGYPPWAAQVTKRTEGIIFPIMGYKVSSENMDSASIVGGIVYRGSADPCLYGRYCLRHTVFHFLITFFWTLPVLLFTPHRYANG